MPFYDLMAAITNAILYTTCKRLLKYFGALYKHFFFYVEG